MSKAKKKKFKPWITKVILISIKNKLYKNLFQNKSDNLVKPKEYKKYINKRRKTIINSIKTC